MALSMKLFFATIGNVAASAVTQNTLSSTSNPTITVIPTITAAPTHPPIPTANILALPSQFSDISKGVISCWDARANYSTASWFLFTELLSSESRIWIPWSTTSTSLSPYLNEVYDCKTTAIPKITTLCDGYPRASTYSRNCQTVTETYTWPISGEASYYTPGWATELDQLPSPTCTVATDYGPECSRLKDVYDWRTSLLDSQVPRPTGSIAGPGCSVLNMAPAGSKPTCVLEGGSWEAFYWPTSVPTGSAFCDANQTQETGTTTIPLAAKTTVVSGLTLTSPSVYHFIQNVTVMTFVGQASLIGDSSSHIDVYKPSTTASLLAVSQRESDILTISRLCAGSNVHRYCTFEAASGFSPADKTTVRVSEYCPVWGCGTGATIYQDNYKPSMGIAVSEIVAQNGVFADCTWTTTGSRVRTKGPPVYNAGVIKSENWHAITTIADGAKKSLETGAPVTDI